MHFALVVSLLYLVMGSRDQAQAAEHPTVVGVLVGSSLEGKTTSQLLHVPAKVEPPIRWQLTLFQDPKSQAPADYKLRCDYTLANPTASAKRDKPRRVEKQGHGNCSGGSKFHPEATVYDLDGLLSLLGWTKTSFMCWTRIAA